MAAKTDAANRRIKKAGEPQFASQAEREISEATKNAAAWFTEATGYEVDERTVQLVRHLNGHFQKSPENQARLQARKAEIAAQAEARAERKAAKAAKKAAKPAKEAKEAKPKAASAKKSKEAPTTVVKRRRVKSSGDF